MNVALDRFGRPISRRDLLKAGAVAGAGLTASGVLGARHVLAQSEAPLAPAQIELWYQDWPPITAVYEQLKASVEAAQPNISITLTKLPYEQLLAKMLPSIAAGEEPEIMMAYSSWLVASDIPSLFTPVAPGILTTDEANQLFYPSALSEGLRGDSLYYLPFLNGMGGSTWTYNVDILEDAGIDPATLTTWDALVEAGKALVQWDGDNLVRAGVAFSPYIASGWVTMIEELGGQYFDAEQGKFTLTHDIAKQALKDIDDLLKVHKVDDITKEAPSHENMTGYGAPDGFQQGKAAITNFGSWIVSGYESTTPEFRAGIFANPSVGTATDRIELGHNGIHVLSRKLEADPAKKAAAKYFVGQFANPANFFGLTDLYGGSVIIPAVARDPSITDHHWGSLQQQYDQLVWPRAAFEEHHVPDWNITVAWPQLLRVFKDSESMDTVLADLESQSNQLEQDARDRLGL